MSKVVKFLNISAKMSYCAAKLALALCVLPVFFILIFASTTLTAQSQPSTAASDSTKRIKVEYSELGEFFNVQGTELQKLKNKVRLRHDSTVVFCDSAIIQNDKAVLIGKVLFVQSDSSGAFADSATYDARTRMANLYGNVALEDGNQTLFTDKLNYDMANKIATYHSGATISNGKSQITSQHGYYYTEEKQVYFKGDVLVTDPGFTLRSDTMSYDTEAKTVHFLAPTVIVKPDSKIYTEGGYYNLEKGVAEFDKNPQFVKGKQTGRAAKMRYFSTDQAFELFGNAEISEGAEQAKADTILYNEGTGKAFLLGNASYKDSKKNIEAPRIEYDNKVKNYTISGRSKVSDPPNILEADYIDFNDELGNGLAKGNVIFRDTSSKTDILSEVLNYNKTTDYVNAFGGAAGADRPIMKNIIDNDTLYISADTLVSYRPNLDDSIRLLLAYDDVRIFKKDFQASCDSLSYSSADSVFNFYSFTPLQKPPMLWADSSQFTADTIRMQLKDKKMDRLWLRQNALVLNTEDGVFFNQIKGRETTAYFKDNEIYEMHTEGNAEAVYYALDDKRHYVGVNQTQCSRMKFDFADNQVQGIRFYTEPKGSFAPIKAGDQPLLLPGFNWNEKRKPKLSTIAYFTKIIELQE